MAKIPTMINTPMKIGTIISKPLRITLPRAFQAENFWTSPIHSSEIMNAQISIITLPGQRNKRSDIQYGNVQIRISPDKIRSKIFLLILENHCFLNNILLEQLFFHIQNCCSKILLENYFLFCF